MKFKKIIEKIESTKKPLLALLVDPDKLNLDLVAKAELNNVFCLLVGGSSLKKQNFDLTVKLIKKKTNLPIIIFPGDEYQISDKADGLLFLSLISGNNAEFLIGKQSKTALLIKRSKIPTWPTAYILINGGKISTTEKVTKTKALKSNNEIIARSAAAELLGFKVLYLEAGSGAKTPVNSGLITQIRKVCGLPIIAGGGVDSEKKLISLLQAKPNMIVIGNAFEKNPDLLKTLGLYFK